MGRRKWPKYFPPSPPVLYIFSSGQRERRKEKRDRGFLLSGVVTCKVRNILFHPPILYFLAKKEEEKKKKNLELQKTSSNPDRRRRRKREEGDV